MVKGPGAVKNFPTAFCIGGRAFMTQNSVQNRYTVSDFSYIYSTFYMKKKIKNKQAMEANVWVSYKFDFTTYFNPSPPGGVYKKHKPT